MHMRRRGTSINLAHHRAGHPTWTMGKVRHLSYSETPLTDSPGTIPSCRASHAAATDPWPPHPRVLATPHRSSSSVSPSPQSRARWPPPPPPAVGPAAAAAASWRWASRRSPSPQQKSRITISDDSITWAHVNDEEDFIISMMRTASMMRTLLMLRWTCQW